MLRRLLWEGFELRTELLPSLSMVKPTRHARANRVELGRERADAAVRWQNHGRTRNLRLESPRAQGRARLGPRIRAAFGGDGGLGNGPETQRRIFEPFFTTKT